MSTRRTMDGAALARRAAAVAMLLAVAACTADDTGADSIDMPATASPTDPSSDDSTPSSSSPASDGADATAATAGGSVGDGVDSTGIARVPDVGVPGLDDEVVVCRSWSRIAGSFQVVAVASAFGSGDPLEAARLEVIGSPVVVDALVAMVEAWPEELAAEAEVVADQFLGPYVRRADRAQRELVGAGATPEQLDRLASAWLEALAGRDPAAPVLDVGLDADLEALVARAARAFDVAVPPVPRDPTLVTDVRVPATEAFVADRCPDRGTLGGTEVGG